MFGSNPLRPELRVDARFRLAWPTKALIGLTAIQLLSFTGIELIAFDGDLHAVRMRWLWLAVATLAPLAPVLLVYLAARRCNWVANVVYCALFAGVIALSRLMEPNSMHWAPLSHAPETSPVVSTSPRIHMPRRLEAELASDEKRTATGTVAAQNARPAYLPDVP